MADAEPYLRRARELAAADTEQRYSPIELSWLTFFPVEEAWFRRDIEQALSELNRLTASGPPEGYWREWWFRRAGIAYLALGKLQAG